MSSSIWRTLDHTQYFLLAGDIRLEQGDVVIKSLDGVSRSVSPDSLAPFEITEAQAHRIAKAQLGQALDEIRGSIDETLAKYRARLDAVDRTPVNEHTAVTPGAVSGLAELIRELPGAIGRSLSRDQRQVSRARERLTDLEARLKASGIDLDGHLARFADRLASLRTERDAER